jgi:hypothetical protein
VALPDSGEVAVGVGGERVGVTLWLTYGPICVLGGGRGAAGGGGRRHPAATTAGALAPVRRRSMRGNRWWWELLWTLEEVQERRHCRGSE